MRLLASTELRAIACLLACLAHANAYQLAQRWTSTASGPVGTLGNPVTLTWSFLPDNTMIPQLGPSNLLAFLDQQFGAGSGGSDLTTRPWYPFFEQSFARWSSLSGVRYVYEPRDDGVPHGNFPGVLGGRGDIRIAGAVIDGAGGTVGYNFFPGNGDMVLDTSEHALFGNPAENHLRLRNTIMHEHGHGLGLAHVDSSDSDLLMEISLNFSFDGPQIDEIRGAHRAYGDILEKHLGGAGNDTFATAIPLGPLMSDVTRSIGADVGSSTFVSATDVDFASIDDNSDFDFFSLDLLESAELDVILTPVGPTYREGPRLGQQTTIDSAAISNLALTLYDVDGISILRQANIHGVGLAEEILDIELDPGRYFARVSGSADDVQLYRLDFTARSVPEPASWAIVLVAGTWAFRARRWRWLVGRGRNRIGGATP